MRQVCCSLTAASLSVVLGKLSLKVVLLAGVRGKLVKEDQQNGLQNVRKCMRHQDLAQSFEAPLIIAEALILPPAVLVLEDYQLNAPA